LRRYLFVLLVFTLGNSTDAFLLLRAGQLGVPAPQLPLLWTSFHVVKMLSTAPCGALSDRIGRRRVIAAGWAVFALAYMGFAAATEAWHAWGLFAVYGMFYGLTEGTERALMADLSSAAQRGAAFGWYHFTVGLGALPASVAFGLIWQRWGPASAFGVGAALAFLATLLLIGLVRAPRAPALVGGRHGDILLGTEDE
jgi:MFS family permease